MKVEEGDMLYYDHVNACAFEHDDPPFTVAAYVIGDSMTELGWNTDGDIIEVETHSPILTPMDFRRLDGVLTFEWEHENSVVAFMKPYTLDSVVGTGNSTADAAWDLWCKLEHKK